MVANPFIADTFFKVNPSKVLGVQSTRKGRFDSEIIVVKGTIDQVLSIDAVPVKPVDIYPATNLSTVSRQDTIQKVIGNELSEAKTERIKKIRGKKPVPAPATSADQEVYSYREIDQMYNKEISRDEKEAYYMTHPEFNHRLLFDQYTNSREQLIAKGLICFHEGKYVYVYSYQSANITKKISALKRDAHEIVTKFGQEQYDRQLKMLEDVRPKQKSFVGEEGIILLPHSNFAKEHKIEELTYGKPQLNGPTSLFDAFKRWLREIPPDSFTKSNYREVTEFYLENKNPPIADKDDPVQRAKDEKNAINIKQRTKEEGDALFARFLREELIPEDQSRIAYLWNEKYNAIAEPVLTKFPLCFRMSKTFKAGLPLQLTITQRQAVAFQMEKLSGLLAYGVGVGKTLAAAACASQAIDNGLARKPVFVVPTNTYGKWIGELQGFTDKDTGVFNHGALPHLPPVQGLYNLNPVIVRGIKIYTKAEMLQFDGLERAIEVLRKHKAHVGELDTKTQESVAKHYNVRWGGMSAAYADYRQNSKSATPQTFTEFVIGQLKDEYNYMIYSLGTIKKFPDGTIFVITEEGLQRLGIAPQNQGAFSARLFRILSQGENSTADDDDDSGRGRRNAEKERAALEVRIEQTVSSSMKNARLNVEDFGIDWACFDEAHLYKKLFTFVKGQVIGGEEKSDYLGRAISNGADKIRREKTKYEIKSGAAPSGRALSAFVLSHYIQSTNNFRNVINLTATPFTNSPLEVYSMLVLTNFHALEELGIDNMIDFFDTFMKINYGIKYTPQKTVIKAVQLTGYNNLPQLRQIIYSVMDKKDDPNLKRPVLVSYPSIEEGRETTLPMTAWQEELVAQVKDYIQGRDTGLASVCQEAVTEEIENMDLQGMEDDALIAEWERLTLKDFEGERDILSESRRAKLITQIKEIATKGVGTEFSEGDMDESEKLGVRILKGLTMFRQITLSPYLFLKACNKSGKSQHAAPTFREYVETSPKISYCLGSISSSIEFERGRGLKIGGQVIYMNVGVEYFSLIKEYLVKVYHLSENQVGIVTGSTSLGARENIKRRFLSGDILVVIGSATISVGVDLQNNANSLWNLYFDYNPTDAQQINGRIYRQGNRYFYVRINYPQCYGSADPVMYQYLYEKTLRINEIWDRTSGRQELDLRDFDPKQLQKKLITDPVELADWDVLEEQDKIDGEIMFLENRRDSIMDVFEAGKKVFKARYTIVPYLNELTRKERAQASRNEEKRQAKKLEDLAKKYKEDPEKYQQELDAFNLERYDYDNDPEKRYAEYDSTHGYNDNYKDDDFLAKLAKKWMENIREWQQDQPDDWRDEENIKKRRERIDWLSRNPEVYGALFDFYHNYWAFKRGEERILKPMGLTYDMEADPVSQLNTRLEVLRAQLQDIAKTRQEKIVLYTERHIQEQKTLRTVKDRIAEWAAANEKYLPPQQLAPGKPIELPKASMEELQALDSPVPVQRVVQLQSIGRTKKTAGKTKEPVIIDLTPEPHTIGGTAGASIQKQINALHLAKGFAQGNMVTKIEKQINALSIALKFA